MKKIIVTNIIMLSIIHGSGNPISFGWIQGAAILYCHYQNNAFLSVFNNIPAGPPPQDRPYTTAPAHSSRRWSTKPLQTRRGKQYWWINHQ